MGAVDVSNYLKRRAEELQKYNQTLVTPAEQKFKPVSDVSGRQQLARNVVSSWLGQFVFIVAGLIMPRLIDRSLGQEMLGIWDFAWSVVGYFSILQVGIVSSVSRYVAKYQAVGDSLNTNRAVSSATAMLVAASTIMVAVTLGIYFGLPRMKVSLELGVHLEQARLVVLILGLEIAFQSALSAFGGVLTGHHRWPAHYGIQAIGYGVSVVGMVTALLLGGGLPWVAVAHWIGDGGSWLVRAVLAYKVCPQLQIKPRHVHWTTTKSMMKFGGKILIPSTAELFLNQTINLLILAALGPASLAIYARSTTLVRQLTTLVAKVSAILSPSASSLQATGDFAALRAMGLSALRLTALLSFPALGILIIHGNTILQLWMGAAYQGSAMLAIFALSYLGLIVQYPIMGMLAGLNAHGRPGMAHFFAGVCSCIAATIALKVFSSNLTGVVLALGIPLFAVYFIYMPIYSSRLLQIRTREYYLAGFLKPALWVTPFMLIQIAARLIFVGRPAIALSVGIIAGGVTLIPVYWKNVISSSMKQKIISKWRQPRSQLPKKQSPSGTKPAV